ncbi:hypothetical protein EV648_1291 [Kribbella sp. VKM Ac-2568]|nr:hypothetical protein EV648_1291 [Kribbella sp. VKM Ac-2568]
MVLVTALRRLALVAVQRCEVKGSSTLRAECAGSSHLMGLSPLDPGSQQGRHRRRKRNLRQSLASDRLVIVELTGLDEPHARVERTSHRIPQVVAQRRHSMSIRRTPFEQSSYHRPSVPSSLMLTINDQTADPEALVGRINAPHHKADDLLADPNGERVPRAVPIRAEGQVVGHGRNEALLRLLHLQRRACSPVVCPDVFKDHGARLVHDFACFAADQQKPSERAVSVPSLTREFTIQVDRLYAGRTFVQRNWQWAGTSVLAAASIITGIIWR